MPQPMASARNDRLTVVDVYDIAASIGKEFEKIIDSSGPECVTELMPKVINVLEHLEELTSRDQDGGSELEELRFTVERLHVEKAAKAEEREKYERELEQIEELWQSETQDLVKTITSLQDENKSLKGKLKEQKEGQEPAQSKELSEEPSEQIVSHLKDKLHEQRTRMRSLERELMQKNLDVEALQGQVERLARHNAEFRHKSSVSQHRAQHLIQEQVDIEARLHDKECEIKKIRDKMREQDTSPPLSPDDLSNLQGKLEKQGKVVYDSSDPNRPRFTMNELRDVLQERSELRTKLIEVEEQLNQNKTSTSDDKEEPECSSPIDPDAPVQGPINKEPDDKLFPGRFNKENSGIRKFFRFLLSPGSSSSRRKSRGSTQLQMLASPRNLPRFGTPPKSTGTTPKSSDSSPNTCTS